MDPMGQAFADGQGGLDKNWLRFAVVWGVISLR